MISVDFQDGRAQLRVRPRTHEPSCLVSPPRDELALTNESAHGRTYSGQEGTVVLDVHRHGPSALLTVRTDRLRTSKVDGVVRYLMNQLPYQPGDPPRE